MMPMNTINWQMIIRAGKAFKTPIFRVFVFIRPFKTHLLKVFFFRQAHTQTPHQLRVFAKHFKEQGYDGGKQKTHSSNSRASNPPRSRVRLPHLAQLSEFHTEGHSFSLNPQLMSLCVATLMLFRQFSFNAQTVNCSPLNRLLFDKSVRSDLKLH